jgi:dual specificity phosphatase 12
MGTVVELLNTAIVEPANCQAVAPGVFLGPFSAGGDERLLRSKNIRHVLTFALGAAVVGVVYRPLSARDSRKVPASVLHLFPPCCSFIDDALANGSCVLIQGKHGRSRSAAVAAAYLVYKGATFSQAWAKVREVRPWIQPNESVVKQVALFSAMRADFSLCSPIHTYARLLMWRHHFSEEGCAPKEGGLHLHEVDIGAAAEGEAEWVTCLSCATALFRHRHVSAGHFLVEYEDSDGTVAVTNDSCPAELCQYYHVEPMAWMAAPIMSSVTAENAGEKCERIVGNGIWERVRGAILCPGQACRKQLGEFSWDGRRCSCQYREPHAFAIRKGATTQPHKETEEPLEDPLTTAVDHLRFGPRVLPDALRRTRDKSRVADLGSDHDS